MALTRIKFIAPLALVLSVSTFSSMPRAQSGESLEQSPEERDANWTAQDAAREAGLFSSASIATRTGPTLRSQAAAVDFVFSGAVESQTYVYDDAGRPYTHTTLRIKSRLKGHYPGDRITFVQEGGPGKAVTDNVVIVSDAQYFNIGEEELLFVSLDPGNPLITERAIVAQRFRIYKGQVFGVDGHGVLLSNAAGQAISFTRDRHPAPRFSQIRIGAHTLTKRFGDEVAETQRGELGLARATVPAPGYRSSVDIASFSAAVASEAATQRGE